MPVQRPALGLGHPDVLILDLLGGHLDVSLLAFGLGVRVLATGPAFGLGGGLAMVVAVALGVGGLARGRLLGRFGDGAAA